MGRKGRGMGEKLWEEKEGGGGKEGGGAETDRKTETRGDRDRDTSVVEEEGGG